MRRLVAFCALAVALTACGSPQQAADQATLAVEPFSETTSAQVSAAPAPPSTPATTATTAAAATGEAGRRCDASVLIGSVETSEAGAGNRYGKFLVTNNGSAPCTLNGYSGLQLLDENGNPLPTDLRRTQNPGPSPVTLAPGAMAMANLRWSVVPTGDEPVDRPCQEEATSAAAIPPDETEPMTLAWRMGPVCGGGKIEISAFYAA